MGSGGSPTPGNAKCLRGPQNVDASTPQQPATAGLKPQRRRAATELVRRLDARFPLDYGRRVGSHSSQAGERVKFPMDLAQRVLNASWNPVNPDPKKRVVQQ